MLFPISFSVVLNALLILPFFAKKFIIIFFSEAKTTLKIPKRVLVKSGHTSKETVQNESSCFTSTSKNLFALQTDGNSLMLDSFHFDDESSDQDLLLDIPSNGSFPQAELLHPASSFAS